MHWATGRVAKTQSTGNGEDIVEDMLGIEELEKSQRSGVFFKLPLKTLEKGITTNTITATTTVTVTTTTATAANIDNIIACWWDDKDETILVESHDGSTDAPGTKYNTAQLNNFIVNNKALIVEYERLKFTFHGQESRVRIEQLEDEQDIEMQDELENSTKLSRVMQYLEHDKPQVGPVRTNGEASGEEGMLLDWNSLTKYLELCGEEVLNMVLPRMSANEGIYHVDTMMATQQDREQLEKDTRAAQEKVEARIRQAEGEVQSKDYTTRVGASRTQGSTVKANKKKPQRQARNKIKGYSKILTALAHDEENTEEEGEFKAGLLFDINIKRDAKDAKDGQEEQLPTFVRSAERREYFGQEKKAIAEKRPAFNGENKPKVRAAAKPGKKRLEQTEAGEEQQQQEEEEEEGGGGNKQCHMISEPELKFVTLELQKTWRPGAVGLQRSHDCVDKSWYLRHVMTARRSELKKREMSPELEQAPGELAAAAVNEWIAELELSFLVFILYGNFSAAAQWRRMVTLVFQCEDFASGRGLAEEEEAACEDSMLGFLRIVDVIHVQLTFLPREYFEHVLGGDYMTRLLQKLDWMAFTGPAEDCWFYGIEYKTRQQLVLVREIKKTMLKAIQHAEQRFGVTIQRAYAGDCDRDTVSRDWY